MKTTKSSKASKSNNELQNKGIISTNNYEFTGKTINDIIEKLRWVEEEIKNVEALIDFGTMILKYSQPQIEGKVDIRWWVMSGNSDIREPVFVKWMVAKTGKAAGSIAVPKKIVKIKGIFSGFHNGLIAEAVAGDLVTLIAYWKSLIGFIKSTNLSTGQRIGGYRSSNRDIKYTETRLIALKNEIIKRLGKQGYFTPDEFNNLSPKSIE